MRPRRTVPGKPHRTNEKPRCAFATPAVEVARLPGGMTRLPSEVTSLPSGASRLPDEVTRPPCRATRLPVEVSRLPDRAIRLPGGMR